MTNWKMKTESEGIFMDGLGSVHLWAKRRAGQSSVGCQGPGIAHWVSPYALSPTLLPLMPTVHLRMAEQSGDTKGGAAG